MRRVKPATPGGALCLAGCFLLLGGVVYAQEIWLDVPFVGQSYNGCGSACIAMVIRYWDANTGRSAERESESAIYRKLYSRKAAGIPATAMRKYIEEQGFRVFAFEGTWLDLQQHLAKGRPLIVCLKGRSSPHYTVISGIDPDQGVVLMNDPAGRKLQKMNRADFEKGWRGSNHWTLMALP